MGLGCACLGNLGSRVDQQDVHDTVAAVWEAGVRYFDTAPLYAYGLSETRIGAALSRYNRDELVISTKVGQMLVPYTPGPSDPKRDAAIPPFINEFDYSRDAVQRSIEGSLERLQTDRIDIVLIHDPDGGVSVEQDADPYSSSHFDQVMAEAYPMLDDLRSQGVIKALGAGMNQWQMLHDFALAGDFDCFLLAGRYTLLEQDSLHTLLPVCLEKGIRIILGGPFNSGILATGAVEGATYSYKPAPPQVMQRVSRIEAVCARHDVPLAAAALQFPFGHPAVATIIPGMESVAKVHANVQHMQHPIPADLWAELKSESLLDGDAPLPGA
ncbi:MAG: pyridoxal 4-dehydrogenase [Planctomycetaceae bacterium]|nr:pyridoxal 4-dehydrogenase [Planctomycetaceae bacterium]